MANAEVTSGTVTVAGITLQHMSLPAALKALDMDQASLEQVMAPSKSWPFPGHQDGWKMSHDAIRFDMENFVAAVRKTKSQIDGGKPLEKWQVEAYQLIMRDFHHTVHAHHDHEEQIFFPWMNTRVNVPEKMSADHKTLMALLDKARDLCGSFKPGGPNLASQKTALAELQSTIQELRACMGQHLEEEEIVGLPLLRKHFTAKEAAVTEKKILADLKPSDMAWFLRPLAPAERRATMTRLGIPGLVQRLVMLPAVAKDERTVLQAYKELAAGERLPLPEKRGFMCFSA